jgi:hypothetical protein
MYGEEGLKGGVPEGPAAGTGAFPGAGGVPPGFTFSTAGGSGGPGAFYSFGDGV